MLAPARPNPGTAHAHRTVSVPVKVRAGATSRAHSLISPVTGTLVGVVTAAASAERRCANGPIPLTVRAITSTRLRSGATPVSNARNAW